ncbi:WD40 repeat domain-containing protein [Lentzea sp. NPDC059081]|uniref:WD40 repeat domain-containing protein n=1 Tax=Lentzea sp. NPDC059081 TaxID=3346719 RepID=UPI0036C767E3
MRFLGVLVVVAAVSTAVSWLLASGLDTADKIASVVGALAAVASLGFAVWAWGKTEQGPRPSRRRVVATSAAVLVVAGVPPLIAVVTADPPPVRGAEWAQQALLTGSDGGIESLSFSPNGKLVAAGSFSGDVHVWDVRSGDLVKKFTVDDEVVEAVAFSPDGARLAAGGWDGRVRLFDTDTWALKTTFTRMTDWVDALAYSPDGDLILIRTAEASQVRKASGRDTVAKLGEVDGAVFVDDTSLAVSGDHEIRLYDTASEDYGRTVLTVENSPSTLVVSRDGTYLAVEGGHIGAKKKDIPARVWDLKQDKDIALQDAPPKGDAMAFTRDNKHLFMNTGKGGVGVWSLPDGRRVTALPEASSTVNAIATGPDDLVAVGGQDNVVRLFRKLQT